MQRDTLSPQKHLPLSQRQEGVTYQPASTHWSEMPWGQPAPRKTILSKRQVSRGEMTANDNTLLCAGHCPKRFAYTSSVLAQGHLHPYPPDEDLEARTSASDTGPEQAAQAPDCSTLLALPSARSRGVRAWFC